MRNEGKQRKEKRTEGQREKGSRHGWATVTY